MHSIEVLFQRFLEQCASNFHVHDLLVRITKLANDEKLTYMRALDKIENLNRRVNKARHLHKNQVYKKFLCKWLEHFLARNKPPASSEGREITSKSIIALQTHRSRFTSESTDRSGRFTTMTVPSPTTRNNASGRLVPAN